MGTVLVRQGSRLTVKRLDSSNTWHQGNIDSSSC